MECGDFIAVMLKRHCQDYKDGNSQYFTENIVTDYMLVTYSRDGKILDFKTVGHDGRAYFTRIAPNKQVPNFLAEQGSLDFSLIPDTLDCGCWPRYLQWTAGRYIESNSHYFFFVCKSCMMPLTDSPYTYYMVLTFNKNGIFKEALNILHVTDDSYIEDLSSTLTSRLKSYEKLWII